MRIRSNQLQSNFGNQRNLHFCRHSCSTLAMVLFVEQSSDSLTVFSFIILWYQSSTCPSYVLSHTKLPSCDNDYVFVLSSTQFVLLCLRSYRLGDRGGGVGQGRLFCTTSPMSSASKYFLVFVSHSLGQRVNALKA